MRTVTDHQHAGAREVAERIERALRAALLDDGDGHDHEDEPKQHERVGGLPHQEVDASSRDQHDEHRLSDDLERDGQHTSLLLGRQLVWAFCLESLARVVFARAHEPRRSSVEPVFRTVVFVSWLMLIYLCENPRALLRAKPAC